MYRFVPVETVPCCECSVTLVTTVWFLLGSFMLFVIAGDFIYASNSSAIGANICHVDALTFIVISVKYVLCVYDDLHNNPFSSESTTMCMSFPSVTKRKEETTSEFASHKVNLDRGGS